MQEYIRRFGQKVQSRTAFRGFQVKTYAALVAVQIQKAATHARVSERLVSPKGITIRAFDLDHVGSKIGKNMGCERTHDYAGQVQDSETSERTTFGLVVHDLGSLSQRTAEACTVLFAV